MNVAKLSPPYRSKVHHSSGRDVSRRVIEAGSSEERLIQGWLQDHGEGWRADFVSYVPSSRIVGDKFNLNVSGRLCVLNYEAKPGQWVQVSRSLEDSDALSAAFAAGP